MRRLGRKTLKIPEIVMCGLSLRDFGLRFGFPGVNYVGEFNCVLDEEDGDVVAYDIPVALSSVEFDGEATDVADCVGGAA